MLFRRSEQPGSGIPGPTDEKRDPKEGKEDEFVTSACLKTRKILVCQTPHAQEEGLKNTAEWDKRKGGRMSRICDAFEILKDMPKSWLE
jgi:hypothetical protein